MNYFNHSKPLNIIIGISGSIAAYKSCELIRLFKKSGHSIKVITTGNAAQFIHPNTFAALSQNPVHSNLFASSQNPMLHIELAKWADLIIIAPATATTLSQLAQGQADTLLSCTCLAATAKCYLAPAMNQCMWKNPATQHNVALLKSYGYHFFLPSAGEQACGDIGYGRMAEPEMIFGNIFTASRKFSDLNVLITAGPTIEKLDPVRYLSNFSSGKMGYALANAFQNQGAKVSLISGPTHIEPPPHCLVKRITTAKEMLDVVMEFITSIDIFICAAAVADYSIDMQSHKIKKEANNLILKLKRTTDIVSSITNTCPHIFTVGFCAETQNIKKFAQQKLAGKKCHAIVANHVSSSGFPFNEDSNVISYFNQRQQIDLPLASKQDLANHLVDYIYKDFKKFKAKLKFSFRDSCHSKNVQ